MSVDAAITAALILVIFVLIALVFLGLRRGTLTERCGVVLVVVLPNVLISIVVGVPLLLFASAKEARGVLYVLLPYMVVITLIALFAWGPMTGKGPLAAFRVLLTRGPLLNRRRQAREL